MTRTALGLVGCVLLSLPVVTSQAAVLVSDNFDSYTAGAAIGGPNWNPKWDSGDTTQQNLFTADAGGGGYAVLDTTVAKRSYHVPNQTGFAINTGETVTVSADVRYHHESGGDITTNLNKAFSALLLTTQPQWWNGTNKGLTIANRGPATGSTLIVAPWVEGWIPHGTIGVNTSVGGYSDWLTLEWDLTDNGTNVEGTGRVINKSSSATLYTTTPLDLGIATGTTVYAGFSTDWNDVGAVPINSFSKIDEVNFDNFQVTLVPELGSMALAGLGGFGLLSMFGRRHGRALGVV